LDPPVLLDLRARLDPQGPRVRLVPLVLPDRREIREPRGQPDLRDPPDLKGLQDRKDRLVRRAPRVPPVQWVPKGLRDSAVRWLPRRGS